MLSDKNLTVRMLNMQVTCTMSDVHLRGLPPAAAPKISANLAWQAGRRLPITLMMMQPLLCIMHHAYIMLAATVINSRSSLQQRCCEGARLWQQGGSETKEDELG